MIKFYRHETRIVTTLVTRVQVFIVVDRIAGSATVAQLEFGKWGPQVV